MLWGGMGEDLAVWEEMLTEFKEKNNWQNNTQ